MADTRAHKTGTAATARRSRRVPQPSSDAFGPFQVLKQIGAGSLGPVYSALQHEIDCLVAVKQFNLGLPVEHTQRVLRQFDALVCTRLDHLTIAASLGTGIRDASTYLIQEFAPGLSLAHLWDEGRTLSVPDALRLTVTVADAIDFAARAGVEHGSLKPQDIIIAETEVRVTGFGVVRALERAGVNAPARTPYAAPERLMGGAWNHRADAFSVAAIVFELLCGQAISGSHAGVLEQIEPIAGTDFEALVAIFDRALSPSPAQRFESATAFALALQDACHVPVHAAGAFRRRRPYAPVPRPPALRPQSQRPEPLPAIELSRAATTPLLSIELSESSEVSAFEVRLTPDPAPGDAEAPTVVGSVVSGTSDVSEESQSAEAPSLVAIEALPVSIVDGMARERVPRKPRRYSILWPLLLGPIVGIVIGLALALMYSRQPARTPPRGEFIRHPEPPILRPPDRFPPRPVDEPFDSSIITHRS